MLWTGLGPIRPRHETRAVRANARFENQAFQNQQTSVQGAKGQLILFLLKEKPPDGWSSLSPLTVLTPSKPRLILTCIVGIKIDVQARYSSISKLEDVAETTTGSFAPAHDLPDILPQTSLNCSTKMPKSKGITLFSARRSDDTPHA